MHRVLLAGTATLQELETWYSIDDLADANDALDAKQEAERRYQDQIQAQMPTR